MAHTINDGYMRFSGYSEWSATHSITSGLAYSPNGAEHLYWPRILDKPPVAQLPIDAVMQSARTASSGNFDAFKRVVQTTYQAGYNFVAVVPLKIFEVAKRNLSNVHLRLHGAKLALENTAFLTGFGALAITLGALGVFLTQADAKGVPSKRAYLRITSYTAMIAGLALVIYSAYMAETAASGLNEVFKDLPAST